MFISPDERAFPAPCLLLFMLSPLRLGVRSLDDDDIGLDQSKIIVIDSNSLERDDERKTGDHPRLRGDVLFLIPLCVRGH